MKGKKGIGVKNRGEETCPPQRKPGKPFLPLQALPAPARGSVDPHWDVGRAHALPSPVPEAPSLAPKPRGLARPP